jgi:predicted metal-dependent hydrolase
MKRRWGSCTRNGVIHLNPELIAAPKQCMDYVIIHELCHLKEFNHSRKFWDLVRQTIPNPVEYKKELHHTQHAVKKIISHL